MLCAFYSVERQTGQSMALANVAHWLSFGGRGVVVVDWDLESPGLHRLLLAGTEAASHRSGLIELFLDYKAELSRPARDAQDRVRLPTEELSNYLHVARQNETSGGRVSLLAAGQLDERYEQKVADFDWNEFYRELEGELLLTHLRVRLNKLGEFILMDAGTGANPLAERWITTICDAIVMFCPAQGVARTYQRLQRFNDPTLVGKRGRPLSLIIVPARINYGEADYLNDFKRNFLRTFSPLVPHSLGDATAFWRLRVPNIEYFSYKPSLVFDQPGDAIAEPLAEAYERLGGVLISIHEQGGTIAAGTPPVIDVQTAEPDTEPFDTLRLRRTERPTVFISYAREDELLVRQLYQTLVDAGMSPWLDKDSLFGGEDWERVIQEQIERADFVLVCLSHSAIQKRGYVQKEIKKTLDVVELQPEGTVYLIPVRLDLCEIPRSLSRFNCIDLFDEGGIKKVEASIRHAWRQTRERSR